MVVVTTRVSVQVIDNVYIDGAVRLVKAYSDTYRPYSEITTKVALSKSMCVCLFNIKYTEGLRKRTTC